MKKLSLIVISGVMALGACSSGAPKSPVVYTPEPEKTLPSTDISSYHRDYNLVKVYTQPGDVMRRGGVQSDAEQISVNDAFVTKYVLSRPVQSDYVKEEVKLGGRVPDEVRTFPVPSTPYAYSMMNGRLILIDPNRRRIVKIY